jgi:hypothetical protein
MLNLNLIWRLNFSIQSKETLLIIIINQIIRTCATRANRSFFISHSGIEKGILQRMVNI